MKARELDGTTVGRQIRIDYGDPRRGDDLVRGRLDAVTHNEDGTSLEVAVGADLPGGGVLTLTGAEELTVELTS